MRYITLGHTDLGLLDPFVVLFARTNSPYNLNDHQHHVQNDIENISPKSPDNPVRMPVTVKFLKFEFENFEFHEILLLTYFRT